MDRVAQVVAQLVDEAGLDEGLGPGVDALLGLRGVSGRASIAGSGAEGGRRMGGEQGRGRTWPREKPTATMPRSSGWERNCAFSTLVCMVSSWVDEVVFLDEGDKQTREAS